MYQQIEKKNCITTRELIQKVHAVYTGLNKSLQPLYPECIRTHSITELDFYSYKNADCDPVVCTTRT